MLYKTDLELEIDYTHSTALLWDSYYIFADAGSVGSQPITIEDLYGGYYLAMTYGTGTAPTGLVGDGAMQLANHTQGSVNTHGTFDGVYDSTFSDAHAGKSRILLMQCTYHNPIEHVRAYLIDFAGFQVMTDANGDFWITLENYSSHRSYIQLPSGTFAAGESLTIAALLDHTNDVALFIINGVKYTPSQVGNPFSTNKPIANRLWVGRTNSWNNYYGWNGQINYIALSHDCTGKEPTEEELIALTLEEYPAIKRKQKTIEYCLSSDGDGVNNSGNGLYASFPALTAQYSGTLMHWKYTVVAACSDSLEVELGHRYSSWYCRLYPDGRITWYMHNVSITKPAGTVPNPTEFNKITMEVIEDTSVPTRTMNLYLNDTLIGTGSPTIGGTPDIAQLFRYHTVTSDIRYKGRIKSAHFQDFYYPANNRLYNLNTSPFNAAQSSELTIEDSYGSGDVLTIHNIINGGYIYGYGESDGLQGDGDLELMFDDWVAAGIFEVEADYIAVNEASNRVLFGSYSDSTNFVLVNTSNNISASVNSSFIPNPAVFSLTAGEEYNIKLSRDASNYVTLSITPKSSGVATNYTSASPITGNFTVNSALGNLYNGNASGKLLTFKMSEAGGDNRNFDLTNIVLGKVIETLQGKHGYVVTTTVGKIYSPVDKDTIIGYQGAGGFHCLTMSTFTATNEFSIKLQFYQGNVYTSYDFYMKQSSEYGIQLLSNGYFYIYINGQIISNATAGNKAIPKNSLIEMELARDSSNNVTLTVNGELYCTVVSAQTLILDTVGTYLIGNGAYDDKFIYPAIGQWYLSNLSDDIRNYDFTTGDVNNILNTLGSTHMSIAYIPQSGLQPIINKDIYTVGTGGDYPTPDAAVVARKNKGIGTLQSLVILEDLSAYDVDESLDAATTRIEIIGKERWDCKSVPLYGVGYVRMGLNADASSLAAVRLADLSINKGKTGNAIISNYWGKHDRYLLERLDIYSTDGIGITQNNNGTPTDASFIVDGHTLRFNVAGSVINLNSYNGKINLRNLFVPSCASKLSYNSVFFHSTSYAPLEFNITDAVINVIEAVTGGYNLFSSSDVNLYNIVTNKGLATGNFNGTELNCLLDQPVDTYITDGFINETGQNALKFKGFNFSDINKDFYSAAATGGINLLQFGSFEILDIAYCSAPDTLVAVELQYDGVDIWKP